MNSLPYIEKLKCFPDMKYFFSMLYVLSLLFFVAVVVGDFCLHSPKFLFLITVLLIYIPHTIKLNNLKHTIQCILLQSHHNQHYVFIPPKENSLPFFFFLMPYSLAMTHYHSLNFFQLQVISNIFSLYIHLPILDIGYKINYIICGHL